jgi:hypothetical protein
MSIYETILIKIRITIYKPKHDNMNYTICYDIFTRTHTAYLLGGEFANCYGQGNTPDEAVRGLKIRVYQLRNKAKA